MNKELIYIDQRGLETEKKNIQAGIDNLNTFKNMAIRCLKTLKGTTIDAKPLLTEIELEQLPTNGINILKAKFKAKFPFPNADEDFNYNALGHNPYAVERFYHKHKQTWGVLKYELDGTEYKASSDQPRLKCFHYYADNENKIAVYDALKRYVKAVNELKEHKVLRSSLEISNSVRWSAIRENENRFELNPEGVKNLLSMLN